MLGLVNLGRLACLSVGGRGVVRRGGCMVVVRPGRCRWVRA